MLVTLLMLVSWPEPCHAGTSVTAPAEARFDDAGLLTTAWRHCLHTAAMGQIRPVVVGQSQPVVFHAIPMLSALCMPQRQRCTAVSPRAEFPDG